MINKQDYNTLVNCLTQSTRDNGNEFYLVKDNTPEHITAMVYELTHTINKDAGDLDLSYDILHSALNVLSNVDYDDLSNFDRFENTQEYASPYTATRLSYLNNNNQQDISDIFKEYRDIDIATAISIWYDNQVVNALALIVTNND